MTSEQLAYWKFDGTTLTNRSTNKSVQAQHKNLLQDLSEDALPWRAARGDAKERVFNLLIRDGVDPRDKLEEAVLIGDYRNDPGRRFSEYADISEDLQELFGEILEDHYVIEGRGGARFLFPFQTSLPGRYKFKGRERMFTGKILAFLCQPTIADSGFNLDLINTFYGLFNGDAGLTLLDTTVLEIADRIHEGDKVDAKHYSALAETLVSRHYGGDLTPPGAMLPTTHLRFQRDLEAILSLKNLNRRDLVNYAINIFYLHLALYFQRLGWLLEEEFRHSLRCINDPTVTLAAARRCFGTEWEDSPFAGSIAFRVARGQPVPISLGDECAKSYSEQNRRQLLLPANLSVLGAAREVLSASGCDASKWSFADIVEQMRKEPEVGASLDEALQQMAIATMADRPQQERDDIDRQVALSVPGIEVFRESLLKTRRTDLRRRGRDIVHALALRGGRGYIGQRGRSHFFFEIGQDLLLLLAKVIVSDEQMPFRQFLNELKRYGFYPQDHYEVDRLADTLRVLNLLEKHSDAGEAMYVKHFL